MVLSRSIEYRLPVRREGDLPIKAYGLIGDMRSAALVAADGAIDWLCLPRFDSPAVFCRLLDADRGGYFCLQPVTGDGQLRCERAYLPASNVLATTIAGDRGTIRIEDAFALGTDGPALAAPATSSLLRRVTAVGGQVTVRLELQATFDYARVEASVQLVPGKGAIIHGPDLVLALAWAGKLCQSPGRIISGEVSLADGASITAALRVAESANAALDLLERPDASAELSDTDRQWRGWSASLAVSGSYAAPVCRSVLTLKLLTYQPSGAIIAAPTTSLPEQLGGSRNWDYRYCWLRDTAFTLSALHRVGARAEARAFWRWITNTCAGNDPAALPALFTVDGDCEMPETELNHLSGYAGSRPVRIGNGAAGQRQLDVYGELLDGFWYFYTTTKDHWLNEEELATTWMLLRRVVDQICDLWRLPDSGIWEMRCDQRHYVYSKVLCWVGLDRALRLHAEDPVRFDGDAARWRRERDDLAMDINANGYDAELGSFTMSYDGTSLDAALLRMPLVEYLPANDPRMRGTIERIQHELAVDRLLLRYSEEVKDGLAPEEGAFAICSFWLVSCLLRQGETEQARALFDHLLSFGNDLGLFAEEIDPRTGAALGNFPQGFTHIGIIDAGVELTAALGAAANREP